MRCMARHPRRAAVEFTYVAVGRGILDAPQYLYMRCGERNTHNSLYLGIGCKIMNGKQKREVSILLAGVGGYGKNYLDALTDGTARNIERRAPHMPVRIAGAVEIAPAARAVAAERGIPLFDSLEAFYEKERADLAVLSTPIHLHCEHIKTCVARGSDVLCEKPMCATVDEADEIKRAEAASGRSVWIGYQMSFSRSILALKDDILSGVFGRPLVFKTLVHYPREESYYVRNNWAGRMRAADGRLILDSPVHNAVAHHLNNMLFLLGDAPDRAAMPKTVQAELYRGNPDVDNFDTAAIRCVAESGVKVLFYTSHCLARAENIGPINQYRFERATVVHTDEREHETFYAFLDDGSTRRYCPEYPDQLHKLWDCIEAVRSGRNGAGENDWAGGWDGAGGRRPAGGVEAAAPEVYCVNGAQLSHPIATIPGEYVKRIGKPGERYTEVTGLECMLLDCFDKLALPSELEDEKRAPWVTAGKVVKLSEIENMAAKL